jgi:uncharacterized membrane protein
MAFTETQFTEGHDTPGGQAGERGAGRANLIEAERWAALIGGGVLAAYGLTRRSWGGWTLAAAGGTLLYRGATGHWPAGNGHDAAAQAAGPRPGDRPLASLPRPGIRVEKSVTIHRPPEDLYRFWRDFENLPRFMKHLESVTVIDSRRSRWVARAPLGMTVEWDAEITGERDPEWIAWRSLPGSDIENTGEVRVVRAPGSRGTEVHVSLAYGAPGGRLGAALAKLFGEEPEQQVYDDLRRFKQLMEAGEIPTVDGQPSGRQATRR